MIGSFIKEKKLEEKIKMYYKKEKLVDDGEQRIVRGSDEKIAGRNLLIFFKSLRSTVPRQRRQRRRQSLIKYFHFSRRDIIYAVHKERNFYKRQKKRKQKKKKKT
jgi:hypothetical protein